MALVNDDVTDVLYATADSIVGTQDQQLRLLLQEQLEFYIAEANVRYLLSDPDIHIHLHQESDCCTITVNNIQLPSQVRQQKLSLVMQSLMELV